MDRKRELAAAEDTAWTGFWGLIEFLDPTRIEQPGYYPEWSVKDLMGHIACWQAEAVQMLERVHWDTYTKADLDVDEMNKKFYEAMHDLPLSVVRASLFAARNRMLQEWAALPEPTPTAEEWFVESGAAHYAEHVDRLREWARELG